MLPIPSFHHGWPNLKSICTPSPKLDSVISKVHVSQNMILTSLGKNHRVYMHTLFKISRLYTFYLHLIYIWFSPRLCTEHGSVMFELMARWNVWGLVKILISESSPPLVQTEKDEDHRVFFRIIFCHTRLSTLFGHKIVSCESLKVSIVDMFHE